MNLVPPLTLARVLALVSITCFLGGCLHMLQPRETVLVQQTRYSELEQFMEGKISDMRAAPTSELVFLCYAYYQVRRYSALLDCADALEENIDAGDTSLWNFDFSSAPELFRAEAWLDFGDYPRSLQHAMAAYQRMKASAVTYKQMDIYTLTSAGLAHAMLGERTAASRFIAELETVDTSYPDNLLEFDKVTGLTRIHVALGDCETALRTLDRASDQGAFVAFTNLVTGASVADVNIFTFLELPVRFMRHHCELQTGRIDAARAGLDAMLGETAIRQNRNLHWMLLIDRGLVHEHDGQPADAEARYKAAITIIEAQRGSINTEASKIGFAGNRQAPYRRLVTMLVDQGRHAEAFELAERSKARALVDLLAGKQQFAASGQADQAEIRRLLAELQELEFQLHAQGERDSAARPERVRSAESLRATLAERAPRLAPLVSVRTASAAEILSLLPGTETLVEYYWQDEELIAFVISSGRIRARRLDARNLETLVRHFRRDLARPDSGESVLRRAQMLHERLVRPLRLPPAMPVTVVPHGALHYVPFHALHDGDGYLLDRYLLRTLPSASVLQYLDAPLAPVAGELLALGNPDLGDPSLDLRHAGDEVVQITTGGESRRALTRELASESRFKQLAPGFRRLHIASHGRFDGSNPLQSGLYLAAGGDDDGLLSVSELYEIRLNADLVTLSACETGVGRVAGGDDVIGLSRGFLYAGATSLVSSLWKVDDAATRDLMVDFYRQLEVTGKRDALRRAQQKVRDHRPHPFYWAAFQLTGAD